MRVLVVLVLTAGCRQLLGFEELGPEDAPMCSATAPCAAGVCKLPDGICVECLIDDDCAGAVCDTTNVCVPCGAHTDCGSHACDFATGSCFVETDIAYVGAGGVGRAVMGCLKDQPCPSIDEALLAAKSIIKVEGPANIIFEGEQTIARDVRILADLGTTIKRVSDGAVVRIVDAVVTIEDLEIREGRGVAGDGIVLEGASAKLALDRVLLVANDRSGLNSTAGELRMRRSIVALNNGGGLVLGGRFSITNSLIVLNGTTGSQVGGVRLSAEASTSVFAFNTIANNVTDPNNVTQAAVNCDLGGFAASSNIVADNALGPNCDFDFSLFSNVAVPAGTMNKSGAPMFASIAAGDLRTATFYRILGSSEAIDHADPAATIADDIDGDPRPAAKDMGADEHVP